ncbi:MAG: alpha-ketoglutarate-dependent dioxygenase AlkB [Aureispira sp.]|nr:alpha-ketoglutarate-dependent dioxygenase AlkB [Aureispira sp.]
MIKGITHIESFIPKPELLFAHLLETTQWDERMHTRKTASFGVAYNYSQISYPFQTMPSQLSTICKKINETIGYQPNNCLINLYPDGSSKMGYHSDQIDILAENTGIAIVSLGEERTLQFRNIDDYEKRHSFDLKAGSLVYMTQEVQKEWKHALLKSSTPNPRISLTFRNIVS